MTATDARELLAACKRQRDVWRIGGMPPSPEAVARVERDEATAREALATVTCEACGGRGMVLCGAEVEDGCDACEATGRVDAVAEVERLRERDRLQRMQSTHHALRDIEERDREHNARVAAEAEADGLRRDLVAVARERDEAERLRDHALDDGRWTRRKVMEALGVDPPADDTTLHLAFLVRCAIEERDLYRAALADAARGDAWKCDTHHDGVLATQVHADGCGACDACATGDGREWTDTPHAAAIRRALKATEGER